MVLSSLEDGLDSCGLVHVPVELADGAGGAVDHDVDLAEHVRDGARYGDAGLGESLDALLGDVQAVSLGQRILGFVVGPRLRDTDELHVVLLGDGGRHPLTDRAVSVDSNPDLRHLNNLADAMVGRLISIAVPRARIL